MKTKQSKITFTADDVSELYHIICNRGFCSTRAKLLIALRELDPALAWRIDEFDDKALIIAQQAQRLENTHESRAV